MKLSKPARRVLVSMGTGSFLKSHRSLDGQKAYKLHPLQGSALPVRPETVDTPRSLGLIDSNKKFPVATFWLTPEGRAALQQLDKR
jgi:hypothetical protein